METKRIPVGHREISVEVYAPRTAQKAPGILLLHELYGVIDYYREDAADLAARGYLVYVPDLFAGGAARYCIRAMVSEAGRKNRADSGVNREIHDLLDVLKADPACNGRLGMLGQCLTGGFVLQMAKRDDMLAPVLYHHSLGIEGSGVPEDENLDGIRLLQGHWSALDPFCPASRRERVIRELGDRVEAYIYPMPHGFRSLSRALPGARLAWKRTLAFFDRELMARN